MCISPGMKTSRHPAHMTEGWEAQSHLLPWSSQSPSEGALPKAAQKQGPDPMAKAALFHSLLELVPSYSLLFFNQVNICYTSGYMGWWQQRRRLRQGKMSEVMMKDYMSTLSRNGVSSALLKKQEQALHFLLNG